MQPLKLSCSDHEGARMARNPPVGWREWVYVSDWIEGNNKLLRPMVEDAARKYAKEKNLTPRDCAKVT